MSGWPSSARSGKRRSVSSIHSFSSRRARPAPRQKCRPPPPKPWWSVLRRTSKRCGSSKADSSRLPATYQRASLSPRLDPLAGQLACRGWRYGACRRRRGCSGRTPRRPARAVRHRERTSCICSGSSSRFFIPLVNTARVESLPAIISRKKKLSTSSGARRPPSTSASMKAVVRSSVGCAVRSSSIALTYGTNSSSARHTSPRSGTSRGSSKALVRFVQSTSFGASSRGTPSMSPITIEGRRRPTSWTRSR